MTAAGLVGSVMPALMSPNSVATSRTVWSWPKIISRRLLLIVGTAGDAPQCLLRHAAHFRHQTQHIVGRDPLTLATQLAPFIIDLLAGTMKQLQRLGGQLVVEDVVGRKHHGLPCRLVVDGHAEAVGQREREVTQEAQGRVGAGLLDIHAHEELGEVRIIREQLIAFAGCQQADNPATCVGEDGQKRGLVACGPLAVKQSGEPFDAGDQFAPIRDLRQDGGEAVPALVRWDIAAVDAEEARACEERNAAGGGAAGQLGDDRAFANPALAAEQDVMELAPVQGPCKCVEKAFILRLTIEGQFGGGCGSSCPVSQVVRGSNLRW